MKLVVAILLVILSLSGYAQPDKQGTIWYFGESAGLDFRSGGPVTLEDGHVVALFRGSSVISDDAGNLQIYSDGEGVWNKNHDVIQGGDNLGGGTLLIHQNGVLVPHPKYPDQYYVFYIPSGDNSGIATIKYALVDMAAKGGQGAVSSNNTTLADNVARSVVVVRHCNNRDFWVIIHEVGTANFRVYAVTEAGLSNTPVISKIGSVHRGLIHRMPRFSKGMTMRASTDGRQLAMSLPITESTGDVFAEIFAFDTSTGKVVRQTQSLTWGKQRSGTPNDVIFSANGQFLYVTRTYMIEIDAQNQDYFTDLLQVSLQGGEPTLLGTRKFVIAPYLPEGPHVKGIGDLQMGPDGKIYAAYNLKPFLGVINNPNTAGLASGFVEIGVDLKGRNSGWTLPSLIPPKRPPIRITVQVAASSTGCNTELSALLVGVDAASPVGYQWFLDGTALPNTNKLKIVALKSGAYSVLVAETNGCQSAQSPDQAVTVADPVLPPVVTNNPVICAGDQPPVLSATGPGIRWYADPELTTVLARTTTFSPPLTTTLAGRFTFYATQTTPGNCTSQADSAVVTIRPRPALVLASRLIPYCQDDAPAGVKLSVTANEPVQYEWSRQGVTLGRLSVVDVNTYGTYRVRATNQNQCVATDSVVVKEACFHLFVPDAFTPNSDGLNDEFMALGVGISSVDISIFNRWGELIFSALNMPFLADKLVLWDGKQGDDMAPTGAYTYEIRAKPNVTERAIVRKTGKVLVLR